VRHSAAFLIVGLVGGGFLERIADLLGNSIANLVEGQRVCQENANDYCQYNKHCITSCLARIATCFLNVESGAATMLPPHAEMVRFGGDFSSGLCVLSFC
jgi:hypothetical protein